MGASTNISELPEWQQRFHRRLLSAAGVEEAALPERARRTLAWLSGWDEPTIAGLEDLLAAARVAARQADAGSVPFPAPQPTESEARP